ncbi:MAG TPA: DUF1707 domain-containing protein [Solirubrobacteraceae bacterium]|nr:DUF1707 domain-containing protein [Solirubrobacteraceae bacterium]
MASPPTPRDRYTAAITRTGHLRASDADRDQVAERLRDAATEGRIGFDELEERLAATLASRTYGELETVVADLPSSAPARRRSVLPASPVARAAIAVAIVIPMAVAAILVFAAFVSAWIVWAVIGWYVFGHHRYRGSDYRSHRGYGPRHPQRQAGADPGRGSWT